MVKLMSDPTPATDRHAPIRLLLVDDHEVIRDGVAAMLHRFGESVTILGSVATSGEALAWRSRNECDIVLCDLRIRSDSGIDLCRELLRRWPEQAVVIFTVYDDEQYLFQALRTGARGYLLKQLSGEELVHQLRAVCRGEIVVDPAIAGRVALSAARLHAGEFWPGAHLGLSQRESEVLELVCQGLSNKAIAQRLVVGDETVKSHLSSIYRKLEIRDRAQAVAVALREGLFH
jgi:DNA-binding NarL/FixJ family response regulator